MLAEFTAAQTRQIIAAAAAAPSMHNSQPWQFAADGGILEVRADPGRALAVSDPGARALYLSCGAAIMNACVAIRMAGLVADVQRLPHPGYPYYVLALIRAKPGDPPTKDDQDRYDAIWQRHTNRRPFSGDIIPDRARQKLSQAASSEGVTLRILDQRETTTVLLLAAAAATDLASDVSHQAELRQWIATGSHEDGVPASALPARPDRAPAPVRDRDFGAVPGAAGRPMASYEAFPQLAVVSTEDDEPDDWLRAGQALERVLLTATDLGISASFLHQIMEFRDMHPGTSPPWPWPEHPQTILRLGYDDEAAPTPRRNLDDMICESGASQGT
jgi:hypothetical protein